MRAMFGHASGKGFRMKKYSLWRNTGSPIGGGGVHYPHALVPEGVEPPDGEMIPVGQFQQYIEGFVTCEDPDGNVYRSVRRGEYYLQETTLLGTLRSAEGGELPCPVCGNVIEVDPDDTGHIINHPSSCFDYFTFDTTERDEVIEVWGEFCCG